MHKCKSETIKLLEENLGSTLVVIDLTNIWGDLPLQSRETKEKINRTI